MAEGDGGLAATADALALLAAAVRPDDPAWVAAAADAVVALVADDAYLPDGGGTLRPLLAALLGHPGADALPPPFHHRLATLHAAGVGHALDRAATLLRPLLADGWRDGPPPDGVLLMTLLLRDSLSWLDQAAVSRHHRARFGGLRFADLAIPYNLLFEPHRFRRNRADLAAIDPATLPAAHGVLRAWATGEEATAADGDAPEDVAARRSLAIRRNDPALAPEAAPLVAAVAGWRAGLPNPGPLPRRGRRIASRPWQALRAAQAIVEARVPFVARARRVPKVAVCLSGQLRGYRAAAATLPRLLAGTEAHLFVASWRKLGRSGAEPFRAVLPFAGARFGAAYRRLCTGLGLLAFHARYPILFATLDDTGRVTPDEVAQAYPGATVQLDDDEAAAFAGWSNPDKMHHRIETCFDLAMAAGDYDLVVRLRPDKPVRLRAFAWSDLWAVARARSVIFTELASGTHFAELMCGDQFAVGMPPAMAIYSRTASRWPQLAAADLLKLPPALTGHVSIAHQCWLHSIAVARAPVRFGPLADPEQLSAAAVRRCLVADAAGRMDEVDRALLAAIEADLAAATGRSG